MVSGGICWAKHSGQFLKEPYCLVVLPCFNHLETWWSSEKWEGWHPICHIWNGQSSKCLKPPTRVNSRSITQQATSLFTKRKLLIENRQLQIAGMEARKWLYSGMSRLASGADHLELARLDDGEMPWSIYIPYFFVPMLYQIKPSNKKTKRFFL